MISSGDLDGTWTAVRDGDLMATFVIAGATASYTVPNPNEPSQPCGIQYAEEGAAITIKSENDGRTMLILIEPKFPPGNGYIAIWDVPPPPGSGTVVAWTRIAT